MNDQLSTLLETAEAERLGTGYEFTEGPVWHPDGFFYFVDVRANRQYRVTPGEQPELVRENTAGANGTTFDLSGNQVICEGENRRLIRVHADGSIAPLAERFDGKRLNRPNDVVCKSDGSIYFTDPAGRGLSFADRELPSAVYRVAADGVISFIAECELPNGLAFSPDESVLYVANTRATEYIHRLELNPDGSLRDRSIFADMSSAEEGVPDGIKVDVEGRVYCTGGGGMWVFDPDGTKLGVIHSPELPANMAFGGQDMRTLFLTARNSVYSLRMRVPGVAHPWYAGK